MDILQNVLSVAALLKATDSKERIYLPGNGGNILIYVSLGWVYVESLVENVRVGALCVQQEELSREILHEFFK